jgi:hypothetical protein
MPIPLGILAVAGAGGAAAGAYELIATANGTGSSGVITFSSIPSTYKHLQLRWTSKTNSSDTQLLLTFNSLTSYAYHQLIGTGSTVTSSAGTSAANILLNGGTEDNNAANIFAAGVMDILDYANTTTNKTVRALQGRNYNNRIILTSGVSLSTNAISSITFTTGSGGSYTTASRFSLYGIKG